MNQSAATDVRDATAGQPNWLPPIPQRPPRPFRMRIRWRLFSMMMVLLASGPALLLVMALWPYLVEDFSLAFVLAAIVCALSTVVFVAVVSSYWRSEIVVTAALASLMFSIPAVVWFVRVLEREQARVENQTKMPPLPPPDFDFYLSIALATLKIVLTLGLAIALIASMRREEKI